MQFRRDINGLRAIAVIAVVLYHFSPNLMPGGFAGVDVFFVISGFLMTGIISKGIEQQNFSILQFYIARANRIIPALAVLCFLLLIWGWFYLTPFDYRLLGKHVSSSVSFISNIIYAGESGYFDTSSHAKWLLHTWSLSAEWQFYIIYPIVLVVIRKYMSIKSMKIIVLAGTVIGFLFCVAVTYKWHNLAYYLLPTRAWEMTLGGVAYFYPLVIENKRKKIIEWLGLIAIIGSYFLISKENLWPGYLAIFPVFGAFLVIQAQRNDSFVTGNIIFQKLGTWSYSIYLWHWPIVVFVYYFSLNDLFIYIGIISSVLLGFISYRYIEKIKFKNKYDYFLEYLKYKPLLMVLVLVVVGFSIFKTNGLAYFYNNDIQKIIYAHTDVNPRSDECFGLGKKCTFGTGDVALILIGDSHALSSVSALAASISHKNKSLVFYGSGSCVTLLGEFFDKESPKCNYFMKWVEQDIANNKLPIVIINSGAYPVGGRYLDGKTSEIEPIVVFNDVNDGNYNSSYISHQVETICEFSKKREVYLVRPYPRMYNVVPQKMYNDAISGSISEYKISKKKYLETHKVTYDAQNLSSTKCGAKIIDITKQLCDDEYCFGSANLVPIYSDNNHLTENGAKLLIPLFQHYLDDLL